MLETICLEILIFITTVCFVVLLIFFTVGLYMLGIESLKKFKNGETKK